MAAPRSCFSGPHRLRYIPPRAGPGRGPHPHCDACLRRLLVEGRLRRMPPWADAYLDGFALCLGCLGRPDLREALVGGADLAGWLGPGPPPGVLLRETGRLWLEATGAERARWGRYVPPDVDLQAELRARAAFVEAYLLHGAPAPPAPEVPPPWPQPDPSEDIERGPALTRKRRRGDLRKRAQRIAAKLPALIASGWSETRCAQELQLNDSTLRRYLHTEFEISFPDLKDAYAKDESVEALRGLLEEAGRAKGLLG